MLEKEDADKGSECYPSYWKCNFPMTPHPFVGWLVCHSLLKWREVKLRVLMEMMTARPTDRPTNRATDGQTDGHFH